MWFEALPSILSVFPNEFNKFNNTAARMPDSIYHMTLKSPFISKFALKGHEFAIRKRDVFMDVIACYRHWGANRLPCTIPGIFVGYDFLKAHSKPCKIRHVSTLTVGSLTCGGLLSTLPIRLFTEFYVFCLNIECFFDFWRGLWYWALHHSLNVSLSYNTNYLCYFL